MKKVRHAPTSTTGNGLTFLCALSPRNHPHACGEHYSAFEALTDRIVRDPERERAYGVAGQPRALGRGAKGASVTAFSQSDAFRQLARQHGVTQADALKALKAHVESSGIGFDAL